MNIKKISLFIFFIPTITVILSYLFSLYLNLVPSCIPMIDGCTSISRTGRYFPVNYFFKTFMSITGIFLLLYWYNNFIFLSKNFNSKLTKLTFIIGVFSVLFLFLYIIFLGENNYYKFFRKIGIFIYILFSIVAELFLSFIYYKNNNNLFFFVKKYTKLKFLLSIFLTVTGLILFPFMVMKIDNVANIRNIISWNFFLFIQFNFLLTFYCLVKRKNFK